MFVDTNVLVQARIPDAPHRVTARAILARANQDSRPPCVSRQVLREYVSVTTRAQSWAEALPMTAALRDVRAIRRGFAVLEDGPAVTTLLESLCSEVPVAGKQVYDAHIVATMLAHGERRLATLNAKDFHRYGGRIEIVGG